MIPLIEREFPDLSGEMSIVVEGSFAYGYYDQYSDLESSDVLPDNTSAERAAALQALLAPLRFAPDHAHQEVDVKAIGHLRAGHPHGRRPEQSRRGPRSGRLVRSGLARHVLRAKTVAEPVRADKCDWQKA